MSNPSKNDYRQEQILRIERFENRKSRNIQAYHYSKNTPNYVNESQRRRLFDCHSHLLFRDYYEAKKIKLHSAMHCSIHLLCPCCAVRRASKKVKVYYEKTSKLLTIYPKLHMYHLVLTVKNSEDLLNRFTHIKKSMKTLTDRKRESTQAKQGNKKKQYALNTMFANVIAGVYSIEVKRGTGSNLWHPHIHCILLSETEIDYGKAIEEWKSITVDSNNIHFEKVDPNSIKDAFVETFKYAMKFSEMELEDNFKAFSLLSGKHLMNSFGEYRGLKLDEEIEEDLGAYIELFYTYNGRQYVQQKH